MTALETRTVSAVDGEQVVVEAVMALAAAKQEPVTGPAIRLSEFVDPDALARIFECAAGEIPRDVSVTVPIDGHDLCLGMVDSNHVRIEVREPFDHPHTDVEADESARRGDAET